MGKSKLVNCKSCGAEIAKDAKSCPNCGAKNKKGHPIVIGILIFLVLVIIVSAMGGEEEPKPVEKPGESQVGTSSGSNKDDKNVFSVGEYAELRGVKVSLVSVTKSMGSDFNTPTDGNVFVLCEFEIINDSEAEVSVSSMLSFDAYCDDYACSLSLSALLEKGNKNQLDGTVAPGKKINGVIGYEVPVDWENIEIHFTPNFWNGKDITFIAANE